MKYFNNERFKNTFEASMHVSQDNLDVLKKTFANRNNAHFNTKSALLLSLAVIPNIIKLIKSAIYLAASLVLCICTLGRYTNLNKVLAHQVISAGLNLANLGLSLIVPFFRIYHTLKNGYVINAKFLSEDQKSQSLNKDNKLVQKTWETKANILNKQDAESNCNAYLVSELDRNIFTCGM